jgi:hypothetical protein
VAQVKNTATSLRPCLPGHLQCWGVVKDTLGPGPQGRAALFYRAIFPAPMASRVCPPRHRWPFLLLSPVTCPGKRPGLLASSCPRYRPLHTSVLCASVSCKHL